MTEEAVRRALNEKCYFDLAGVPFPGQIIGLTDGAGVRTDRLLYGSDWPFTKTPAAVALAERFDEGAARIWNEETVERVCRGNAERLFQEEGDGLSRI